MPDEVQILVSARRLGRQVRATFRGVLERLVNQ
jgi:hypothetical protein